MSPTKYFNERVAGSQKIVNIRNNKPLNLKVLSQVVLTYFEINCVAFRFFNK